MIKLFFLAVLFSVASSSDLKNSQSFGLFPIEGNPFELLKLETKATTEGPYVEIQYTFLYKNPYNSTIQTKFIFPPTENAIFHKFEATLQNRTITAKILEDPDLQKLLYPQREKNSSLSSKHLLNIPAQEILSIIFAMIQPLRVVFSKFYELKLPAFVQNLSNLQQWDIEIELHCHRPFAILSNPTHHFPPKRSEQPYHKAFWNVTIAPNQDFIVYFGLEDSQKSQFILAAHPQDLNDHVLLLNSIPDQRYVTAHLAQNMLEETNDGLLQTTLSAIKQGLFPLISDCIFIIDRSDSMRGSKIENLKQKLKMLLEDFTFVCGDFSILSFDNTFILYDEAIEPSGFQGAQKVITWVDTIEADMGGSDLLNALEYISKNYRWLKNNSGRSIILTDGDVSHPKKVAWYSAYSFIIGIGDDASEDVIKWMTQANEGFTPKIQNLRKEPFYWIEARYPEPDFEFGFSLKCHDDQNQLVYQEDIPLGNAWGPMFTQWIYLSNITNFKSCNAQVNGRRYVEKDYDFERETQIFGFETPEIVTDIWHKVAYDRKIKKLLDKIHEPNDEGVTEIINLCLHYQTLVTHVTSLALQTEDGWTQANEFFDLSKFNTPMNRVNSDIPRNYTPLDSIENSEKQHNSIKNIEL